MEVPVGQWIERWTSNPKVPGPAMPRRKHSASGPWSSSMTTSSGPLSPLSDSCKRGYFILTNLRYSQYYQIGLNRSRSRLEASLEYIEAGLLFISVQYIIKKCQSLDDEYQ